VLGEGTGEPESRVHEVGEMLRGRASALFDHADRGLGVTDALAEPALGEPMRAT